LGEADADHVCAAARKLATAHVADIRAKIVDLQEMERVLSAAICEREPERRLRCPVIEVYFATLLDLMPMPKGSCREKTPRRRHRTETVPIAGLDGIALDRLIAQHGDAKLTDLL
jgi:hypothetical protein